MNLQTLTQKLYEQKNRVGLVGGSVKINEYDQAEHYMSAYINLDGWDITVNLKKGFDPIKDKRQKAYARKKGIADGLETLVLHVGGLHEPAHWELTVDSGKGCPFDPYWHDKITEAIKKGLPENKKTHTSYVTNAFEDMIINPRCREFNKDFSGQVLFWDWEGISTKESGQKNYSPFYEAFVKLNMHLWGDNTDRALLKRHYANSPQVEDAVKKVVEQLKLPKNIQDTSPLFNRPKWADMAEKFARELAPLLDKAPKERLSGFKGEGSSGNGIEEKVETEQGREGVVVGRYNANDPKSQNYTNTEQLDSLYNFLARSIPVKVEAMSREQSLQIAPLNFRQFDEEKDNPKKIKLSRLYLTEEGLIFAYQHQPLTIQARSKVQRRSFPNFKMILLDNSGTMKESIDGSKNVGNTSFIPWGDNSRYHFALLGYYGIENFLRQQQIAPYINHGLSVFSTKTRYKESDFSGLDEVRKLALNPDWGYTNLDAKSLEDALDGKESFVLSLSDGNIDNWESEKERIKSLIPNHYFAHIQIGGKTAFTQDLESWKVPVFYVSSGKDLSKLMVDVTKQTYDQFIRI